MEAASDVVEAYRVSKSMLLQYFGGSASEVVYAIRAALQAKKNWQQLKVQQIASLKREELHKLVQFKDESETKGLNPTKTVPGETPYLKTMQTYGSALRPAEGEHTFKHKSEEEKSVPEPDAKPAAPPKMDLRPRPRAELMRRMEHGNEDHKHDSASAFATMRLVASDRMKELNSQQMKGLIALRSIAQDVKSGKSRAEGKGEFNHDTVKRFQKTVMMADPAIAEKVHEGPNQAKPAGGAGMDFFKKMRNFNPGDLRAKLGQ